jgi:hypothetical protein
MCRSEGGGVSPSWNHWRQAARCTRPGKKVVCGKHPFICAQCYVVCGSRNLSRATWKQKLTTTGNSSDGKRKELCRELMLQFTTCSWYNNDILMCRFPAARIQSATLHLLSEKGQQTTCCSVRRFTNPCVQSTCIAARTGIFSKNAVFH